MLALISLIVCRERIAAISSEMNIISISPWDGKDAEPPKEEFSLDEL